MFAGATVRQPESRLGRRLYPNRVLLPLAGTVFAFAMTTLSARSIKTIPPQQSLWHPGDNPARAEPNRNEAGRKSYFIWSLDSTRAISTRRAEDIAAAIQAHGQSDNTTVLTLTHLAAGEEPTTQLIAPVMARA
jgi:hypothetical protein